MRILVTGGAGFIGSHLCEQLLVNNNELTIVDEMNDFYPPWEKERNLTAIRLRGPVRFYRADVSDASAISAVMEESQPEIVVHLAARAGVRPSLEQPLLYGRANVLGTMVMLEESRKYNVRKFIFASSSSIYGEGNRVPFHEDDNVIRPISPYAATKLAGEAVAYTYSHLHKLSVVCLRFFTVYGPRQRPDLAIRHFIQMIDTGMPISVFGNGSSARDYTYVADTVSGIMAAIDYDCLFDTLNLGNSQPINLLVLISTLEDVLGRKAEIHWLPDQPGDVPITFADISRAKQRLGYCPATNLIEGLDRMVLWYRENKKLRSDILAFGV